jgi:transitional endoplasmic reticulum ATPase
MSTTVNNPDDRPTGLEGLGEIPVQAQAEPELAPELETVPEGMMRVPEFVSDIGNIYRANASHVFILHGNVNDYPDNSGVRGDIGMTLFGCYDQFWIAELQAEEARRQGRTPVEEPVRNNPIKRIAARWSVPNGLEFATDTSREFFVTFMKEDAFYKDKTDEAFKGRQLGQLLVLLNDYFRMTARRFHATQPQRAIMADPQARPADRGRAARALNATPELSLTLVFYDARMAFPAGNIAQLQGDRSALAFMESWALDGSIATRNKIILITQRLTDMQLSLRTGESRVACIRIKRPDLRARREWLHNFAEYIKTVPAMINGRARKEIALHDELTFDSLANQMAGMARVQMERIIMESWLRDSPIDIPLVAAHKKAAIEAEYGEILDIKQPVGGWSKLGGHKILRKYADRAIVKPLKLGDRRTCTRGLLLVGPSGVGKTWFAECLAGECGMNYISVDFSKLFGGIVGETERNTERLFEAIEAMSPCIVFADEIDMSFSGGRQSSGDSGVQSRLFRRVLTWMSDDARWGSVVVIMASNRPDLLDAALIRAGRIDDIIPALPPAPGNVQGRISILKALCMKNNIRFEETIRGTEQNREKGLGRMLLDPRIWTGAEQERVIKLAFANAVERYQDAAELKGTQDGLNKRDLAEFIRQSSKVVAIDLADWDRAMSAYRPRTQQMDFMIDLALRFTNNPENVPAEWKARYDDEEGLRRSTTPEAIAGAQSYERA